MIGGRPPSVMASRAVTAIIAASAASGTWRGKQAEVAAGRAGRPCRFRGHDLDLRGPDRADRRGHAQVDRDGQWDEARRAALTPILFQREREIAPQREREIAPQREREIAPVRSAWRIRRGGGWG